MNQDNDFNIDSSDEEEWVSKTEVKRQMHALQALGAKLTNLNSAQLDKLDLNTRLREAIDEFHRIKSNGAQKRHLQFIGRIMRNEDAEAIEQAIGLFEAGHQAHTQAFHKLEKWRDRLINEGNNALQEYIAENPTADIQHMRQLVRNAQKEATQNKPPAAARKLFKYLREVAEV